MSPREVEDALSKLADDIVSHSLAPVIRLNEEDNIELAIGAIYLTFKKERSVLDAHDDIVMLGKYIKESFNKQYEDAVYSFFSRNRENLN